MRLPAFHLPPPPFFSISSSLLFIFPYPSLFVCVCMYLCGFHIHVCGYMHLWAHLQRSQRRALCVLFYRSFSALFFHWIWIYHRRQQASGIPLPHPTPHSLEVRDIRGHTWFLFIGAGIRPSVLMWPLRLLLTLLRRWRWPWTPGVPAFSSNGLGL